MLFRYLVAVVLVLVLFPAVSQAQNRRPLQNIGRAFGVWHGNGRHWQTPGHDSSYYNPWSAHNSGLVTRGYPVQSQYAPLFYSPNQYSHPQYNPSPQYNGAVPTYQPQQPNLPTAPLGGSFEPFEQEEKKNQVPEIDPVDDQLDLPLPEDELRLDELKPDLDSTELPSDALIIPASARRTGTQKDSRHWQGIK